MEAGHSSIAIAPRLHLIMLSTHTSLLSSPPRHVASFSFHAFAGMDSELAARWNDLTSFLSEPTREKWRKTIIDAYAPRPFRFVSSLIATAQEDVAYGSTSGVFRTSVLCSSSSTSIRTISRIATRQLLQFSSRSRLFFGILRCLNLPITIPFAALSMIR